MKIERRLVHSCSAAFFLLLGFAFFLPPGAVWITDNGNKYIQMRNFAAGKSELIRHPCPELFPAGGFHFFRRAGGAVSFYPGYLSAATAPFYRLFGERGVLFWPILATLASLFLAGHFLRLSPPGLLLATPLVFYSLLLWEMTPSVCLVLAGFILGLRGGFFSCGVLWGLSLLMREEAYFCAAAFGAALLVCGKWRELLRFSGGFLLPALPLWLLQAALYGHIFGLHGKFYYLNNNAGFSLFTQARAAAFNAFHHLFRFDGWGRSSWGSLAAWSALLPLAAGAAPGFRRWLTYKYAAMIVYLVCTVFLTAGLWFQAVPVYTAAGAVGLFSTTPLAAGFLINWRAFLKTSRFRVWTWALIFYILGVPLLMTASDVGLVWGARHFLVIVPPLCYLSFIGFRRLGAPPLPLPSGLKLHKLLPPAAVGAGVFLQCYGLYALNRVAEDSAVIEEALLRAPGKTVVTDVFYLPEQTPRLFFGKTVLQVLSPNDLEVLKKFLAKQGEKEFTLVLSPRFRRLPDPVLRELITAFPLTAPPVRLTGKGGFPDLFAAQCRSASPR